MTQVARPISLTSADWTGTFGYLADESDGTFLESPVSPLVTQTFLCTLSSLTDPQVSTGHVIRLRTTFDPTTGEVLTLHLALENSGDSSVIATRTCAVPSSLVDATFTLSAAEAELVQDYAALRVRGYAFVGGANFVWAAEAGATSYVLQVGPSSGSYTTFNADVGNVLHHTLSLSTGTYYSRVVPQGAGSPSAEQATVIA